jgi:spermidine/putrescine transport system permease protein
MGTSKQPPIWNRNNIPLNKGKGTQEALLTLPSFLWLLILFVIPTIMVVIISFRSSDPRGGIGQEWTIRAYQQIFAQNLGPVIWRTIRLSLYTTVICLVLAIPVAYHMARLEKHHQQNLLLLVIIPFWTNFLIRIYAWKVLLHPDGLIKQILATLQLVEPEATLLYNEGAVLLVLVYTYLPFAILPLYSAAEKFDFRLLEASQDLGGSDWIGFYRIFLPGISAGIVSAILVVFIPALGSYIIPEIVGGPGSQMLGNRIAQRVFTDRNLPQASGLSTLLILAVMVPSFLSLVTRKLVIPRGKGAHSTRLSNQEAHG